MLNDIPMRQISLTKLQIQPKKNGFRVKYLVKRTLNWVPSVLAILTMFQQYLGFGCDANCF